MAGPAALPKAVPLPLLALAAATLLVALGTFAPAANAAAAPGSVSYDSDVEEPFKPASAGCYRRRRPRPRNESSSEGESESSESESESSEMPAGRAGRRRANRRGKRELASHNGERKAGGSSAASNEENLYKRHQVFRVVPLTHTHVTVLSQLESSNDLDVWTKSRELNAPWDIRVPPLAVPEFRKSLEENQLEWKVLIPDVGRTVKKERQATAPSVSSRSAGGDKSGPRYLRFGEINVYLDDLAKRFPKLASVQVIGKTSEGREMKVIKISSGKKETGKKPAVWIDAGIHAREWIAPSTAIHIISQLVENNTYTADLTADLDWYILPVMNPDGYEYSHTTDRLWRKTRSKGSSWLGWLGCVGADGNRNFDYHWMEVGASWSSCSATYAGSKAFSESETRAVRDFLLANKDHIKMYLTYHSYGNYLLYPWGYTSKLPNDWKELDSLAQNASKAMVAVGSEPYTIGSSTNVLYAAAGGSDDWAKAVAGIELSYTIELPGGNGYGFDLPASYIPEVGHHQMEAIKVFGSYVRTQFVLK